MGAGFGGMVHRILQIWHIWYRIHCPSGSSLWDRRTTGWGWGCGLPNSKRFRCTFFHFQSRHIPLQIFRRSDEPESNQGLIKVQTGIIKTCKSCCIPLWKIFSSHPNNHMCSTDTSKQDLASDRKFQIDLANRNVHWNALQREPRTKWLSGI